MTQSWALQQTSDRRGFTIVELLIVIVVIGILAAITIVAFNGIQDRAHSTAVSSDLGSIAKKLAVYKVDNSQYPENTGQMIAADFSITHDAYKVRNNLYYCVSPDAQHYAVGAIAKGDDEYYIVDGAVNEVTAGTVSWGNTCPQIGGPNDGSWWNPSGYDSSGGSGWADWFEE